MTTEAQPATSSPPPAPELDPRWARRRSNTELRLLIFGLLAALTAYTLIGVRQAGALPVDLVPYGGALAALAALAHVCSRWRARGGDPVLLPLAFALNALGLVMVRRIDYAESGTAGADSLAAAQTLWTIVGIGAFCLTLFVIRDYRLLDRYRYLIGVLSLALLLLPLLPIIGREVNGARLWLRFGSFSIQPGEFAKLGIVIFFASYLAQNRQLLTVATNRLGPLRVPPARAFGPIITAWAISLAVLVFERDLGLSLLFFGIFVVMLYVATARVAYVVVGTTLFASGAAAAYAIFSHVQERIDTWLDPWSRINDEGFQLAQSLFALGTGGVLGVGWGNGRPDIIPEVQTDFIFSVFGEELGLLGTTALLLIYFLFVARGFRAALRCDDDFGQLLTAGLTALFGLQVFVILGGVTRLIPLTGLTLPFVSFGGSSLVGNYILVALLLRVSASEEPRPVDAEEHR